MAGVAKGIAGLGALFYVAYRVWQSLARAEPIDVLQFVLLLTVSVHVQRFRLQHLCRTLHDLSLIHI